MSTLILRPWLMARWVALTITLSLPGLADGPADNQADRVRRVPPAGLAIPGDIKQELVDAAARLGAAVDAARGSLTEKDSAKRATLPDIAVFHKAVDWALRYDEVFRTNEIQVVRTTIQSAHDRLAAWREGRTSWVETTGPVALGYVSRIDDSLQPYGLVIPASYRQNSGRKWRLDFWFHGRGEQLSELAFINDRTRNLGEFAPADAFVLHLYGRYCNGSRFAGETDFWEALAEVQRRFPIDENRLVVRGFSLGGASCWHMAMHHAGRWAAAAPGAGFSETEEFLNVFQKEQLQPNWWEQKLWRLYDATSVALNTAMVPLVAYSGADDSQIQAARAMERALAGEGMELTHLIGPKTGHSYEKNARAELNRRIDALAERGRTSVPRHVQFATHSLRYNQMSWITLDGLATHWEPARIDGRQSGPFSAIEVNTTNVTALTLSFGPGEGDFDPRLPVQVALDGATLTGPKPGSDRSWKASFHKDGGVWKEGRPSTNFLRKVHGLQGPIDDAFMDSFLFVRPTGTAMNPRVGAWTKSEFDRAVEHWRRHYRGNARIKDDSAVTDADLAAHHVVLWGDPKSNRLMARMAEQLPIRWSPDWVRVGGVNLPAASHAPVMIYPNPLNPRKYVVLNSSFTFRDYDYLNNARQTAKLPDWAVVDLTTPPGTRWPGKIAAAGFFGEQWELK